MGQYPSEYISPCLWAIGSDNDVRTDLADGGAAHFADTIRRLKQKYVPPSLFLRGSSSLLPPTDWEPFILLAVPIMLNRSPHILVEALTGDFQGVEECVAKVAQSGLDVYAHNLETVEARTPFVRDPRATFRQSLKVLEMAKAAQPNLITKTSLMLGVGEQDHQVEETLRELRKINVDVVTFGQYMRPTKRHMKVHSYVEPAKFDHWAKVAEDMGFMYVASGPLVRSSFKANELLKSSAGKRLLKGLSGRDRGVEVGSQPALDATSSTSSSSTQEASSSSL